MTLLLHALLLILVPQSAAAPPAEVRASFLKLLDRPRVPLDARVESSGADRGFVVERLSSASETKADGAIERVPTLIVRPSGEPRRRRVAWSRLRGHVGTATAIAHGHEDVTMPPRIPDDAGLTDD